MSITVKLIHSTDYVYDRKISLLPHVIRLRPAPHTKTKIPNYSLSIFPETKFVNWQQDPFSNWQARIVFPERTDRLTVTNELLAEISVYNPFDFFTEPYAENFPFTYESALRHELTPCLKVAEPGKEIEAFIEQFDFSALKITDFLVQLLHTLGLPAIPDPEDASVRSGVSDLCNTDFNFEMKVQRSGGGFVQGLGPYYSLHPTIPVHSPLNFSLYDKSNETYVAGSSYHVSHSGGLAYSTFPVNSYEAESRRLSRFHENAVYPDQPPRNVAYAWYRHTLDLRTA